MFPFVDLDGPTHLAFQWGWLLGTVANTVVVVLLVIVFVLGVTLRVPGVRDLQEAELAEPEAGPSDGRRSAS